MEFKTNHTELYPPSKPVIPEGHGIKLPEDRDIFFRAKQCELVDQYTAARFFLSQTDGENYKDWLSPTGKETVDAGIQNTWKSYFYEELFAFDDDKLFPYLQHLVNELEKIVQPSPMVF